MSESRVEQQEQTKKDVVLLVEDNQIMAETLERFLRRKSAEVLIANSSEAAAELLEKGGITRVISDGLGGDWEKVAEDARKKEIPIKILSAEDHVVEDARKRGFEAVLKEDIDPKTL